MNGSCMCVCGSMPPGITILAVGINDEGTARHVQVRADSNDFAFVAQHVGTQALIRIDHRAAL